MYQQANAVLISNVCVQRGFASRRYHLQSNGTYLRRDDGHMVAKVSPKYEGIMFAGEYRDTRFVGQITDKILVERTEYYWNEYAGKRRTNCAAFAHFLTTGQFIECEPEFRNLVLEQGMRPYEMASRVDVGDMVCLMYAHDRIARSRRNPWANRYRKAKKYRHDKDGFAGTAKMGLHQKSLTTEQIRGLYDDASIHDYHFMVCVGHQKGKPIWISQGGYSRPGEMVRFTVTCGETDSYLNNTPVFAFIKKRR